MEEEKKPKLVTKKIVVRIDDVIANPWNPNRMSDYIYQKMKATIEEKGLFGSVFVRPLAGCYQILDGEHRWKAMKELGYKEIPVECSIEEITDEETKFWTLYFNNTKGQDDAEKVAVILEQLDNGQSQLLPFTEEEIKNKKELFKFDFSKYDKKEDIEARNPTRNLIIPLEEDEYSVVQQCLDYAKREYQQDLVPWLMEVCGDYLDVRIGTQWRQKDF